MATQLDALKELSHVVADTGDLDAIRKYQPMDATTNPSLILKAFDLESYQPLIKDVIERVKKEESDRDAQIASAVDHLAVAIGSEIAGIVPGRVSTEVSAKLSFDTEASIEKAHHLIKLYEERGVSKDRVLIKLASTWEGIRAAESLEKEGINCNLTLLFSDAQARACFEAGVFLISPFVGRVTDWYKKETGKDYTAEEDPGVKFVRNVCQYASDYGYETVVMGASFRNTGQILALAGCNRLTISPQLLEELSATEGKVERKVSDEGKGAETLPRITESEFRFAHNEDAMANDKLAEGIRKFAADQDTLEEQIAKLL
ncbi:transaldolase [Larsenimonas rhizosphaerae]|uniref:Transaldolase n=1 Tax=Larsenimonas rhizosphaerae TaxID=2944682 RepID=A0AA42CXZ7_9GAMM|nr:transaldolase [Larsenimonas rhizosphaerae]MCM2129820.1 transaldolase [Larsenimonas rhizosphaerae]MCX2524480.1 transaldolase [Larsenimonas rhizosphaerae]